VDEESSVEEDQDVDDESSEDQLAAKMIMN
jgi:hypothetical protein